MRVLSYLLLALLAPAAAGADNVQVANVRIWAAPDSTRVVFDVSSPVQHSVELLSDPFRVVVDIEEAKLAASLSQPTLDDKFLQRVRTGPRDGGLRVVLDLKKYARMKSFLLQPNQQYGDRLVVDLYGDEADPARGETLLAQEAPAKRDVVIAIDAGHGGEDPGARGPNGTYEKHVVLELARRLADLANREPGMSAVLVRDGDYYLSLRKRMDLARRQRADLFVSIHADAFKDSRVRGASVYVLSQRGASSEHARWLAEQENASDLIGGVSLDDKDDMLAAVLLDLSQTASLEASLDVADRVLRGFKKVGAVHRGRVESAAFAVLKSPDIPSILVESAYISNPDEERKLRSSEYQQRMATAILEGVRGYFRISPPEDTQMAAARRHVIAHGDTLSGIAQSYGISVERLRSINRLDGDTIRTGQILSIPAAGDG
ncbi:MAG: N-acetylmuramoyl-L-alanine amidase [Gammaproteobacteria bacterium]|nr:N-acetylmuramoyl-L-alanine amidase [Gammaproteobacteria bacterium]